MTSHADNFDAEAAKPRPRRPRRRWWQRVIRISVLVVVALTAAYVTLPWWFPGAWVRAIVVNDLAAQLGVPVKIERASLSWRNGVELEGLTIASPEGFSTTPMVSVRRIRTEFTPLTLLLRDRIEWLEIDSPQLRIEMDGDGNINAAVFRNLSGSPKVDRITVHHAAASIQLPQQPHDLRFEVANLQLQAGRLQQMGRVTVTAALQQESDQAPVTLQVEGDQLEFAWNHVDLGQLNLPSLLDLPLKALTGRCDLAARLSINQEGLVDRFELNLSGQDLDVVFEDGPEIPTIEEAYARIEATYDPLDADGRLEVRSMHLRISDALELAGAGVVYTDLITGNWQALRSLHVDGQVAPDLLAAMATGHPEIPGSDVVVSGPIRLALHVEHDGPVVTARATADASGATVHRNGHLLKPSDRQAELTLVGRFDQRRRDVYVDELQLTLGGNALIARGAMREAGRWLGDRADQPLDAQRLLNTLTFLEWTADWRITELASLTEAFSSWAPWLTETGLEGDLIGQWRVDDAADRVEFIVSAPVSTALSIGSSINKPAGQAATVHIKARLDPDDERLTDVDVDVTAGTGRLWMADGQVSFPDGQPSVGATRFEVNHVENLLACFPVVAQAIGELRGHLAGRCDVSLDADQADLQLALTDVRLEWTPPPEIESDSPTTELSGPAELELAIRRSPDAVTVAMELTGDEMVCHRQGDAHPLKPRGARFGAGFAAEIPTTGPEQLIIARAEATLGESRVHVSDLHIATDGRIEGDFEGRVWPTIPLLHLQPQLAAAMEDAEVAGPLHFSGRLERRPDGTRVLAEINASDVSLRPVPGWAKPAGVPIVVHLRAEIPLAGDSIAMSFDRGQIGPLQLSGSATVRSDLTAAEGVLTLTGDDWDGLPQLAPQLDGLNVRGHLWVATDWQWCDNELAMQHHTALSDFSAEYLGRSIALNGETMIRTSVRPSRREFELNAFDVRGVRFEMGRSRGWVVTSLTGPAITWPADAAAEMALTAPGWSGQVYVTAEALDTTELARWFAPGADGQLPAEIPTSQPARPAPLTLDEQEQLRASAQRFIDVLTPFVLNSTVSLHASIDRYNTFDALIQQPFELTGMELELAVRRGRLNWAYVGGLNGGCLRRQYAVDLTESAPMIRYHAEVENVAALDNIKPLVAWRFPGNTVNGLFSHSETLAGPFVEMIAHETNLRYPFRPVGTAKTVTTDGIAEGQAAPEFVTDIFPGLNTARYSYNRMTSFATHRPDGVIESDTIFNGVDYDTYMEGTTDTEDIADYEIGVILLGSPQTAEWNHTYRQGRIPILQHGGRIVDGEMLDVRVRYVWPTEAMFAIFLKNNMFYRLWLAAEGPETEPGFDNGGP